MLQREMRECGEANAEVRECGIAGLREFLNQSRICAFPRSRISLSLTQPPTLATAPLGDNL